jgi:hypothetical protein
MARQGKPWDLMAWGFGGRMGEGAASTKTPVQLKQEAAVVLSLGGGFQAYFKQKDDASINDWTMSVMAEVAEFCRARQGVCHKAELVPQVGLVMPGETFYRMTDRVFSPWGGEQDAARGVLNCLLDSQLSVEVLMEHHLDGRMGEYPLLVVPEWAYLPPKLKRALHDYAAGGGSLLLIGPAAARLFSKALRVRLLGQAQQRQQWLAHGAGMCGLKAVSRRAKLLRGARAFGRLYAQNDVKGPDEAAASVAKLGKGRIAATYVNLGERYLRGRTALARDFLAALVRELFPAPMVEVAGSHCVDVVVARKDGRLAVNLVNTAGAHQDANVYTYDEVPPVGPLEVVIRPGRRVRRVRRYPSGRLVTCARRRGEVRLKLRRLALHEIIVVE